MSDTVLWWLRRDLRLADNDALAAALAGGRRVVPVFVLDPVSYTHLDVYKRQSSASAWASA